MPAPVPPVPAPAGRRLGVALIALSAASFGTLAIFARLAYAAGGEPVAVLFLRFAGAAVFMWGLMAARRQPLPRGSLLVGLILMGGLGYVGQSLSFFTALLYASAGLVALLLYLYPAIVTVLSAMFLRERLTPIKLLALFLAIGGTALTIGRFGGGQPLGIVLGIAAAFIYSVYILVGSRITPRAGAIASSTVIITSGAVVFGLLTLLQRPAFPQGRDGLLAALGVSVVATVLPIVTFFAGLARLGPADAATLSTLEPVVTVALAGAILGEAVTGLQLVGGALILVAVVILGRSRAPAEANRAPVRPRRPLALAPQARHTRGQ